MAEAPESSLQNIHEDPEGKMGWGWATVLAAAVIFGTVFGAVQARQAWH
eukprot:gene4113-4444_t